MKVLLDENIPLQLSRRLRDAGVEVEHLIEAGERGIPDSTLRDRLTSDADLVLVTNDKDFRALGPYEGKVIISRVRQALPVAERVDTMFSALRGFLAEPLEGDLFALFGDGEVVAWEPPESRFV